MIRGYRFRFASPRPFPPGTQTPLLFQARFMTPQFADHVRKVRNIGISAHIDSGKTTLSERILFFTGRINAMHEVKGSDKVGAVMDHGELERERGITIRSAATFCKWKDSHINLIDTPGHVDFTIEVERALRVLDGAILLLCGVGGVQSQTLTVDRQMRRYGVARICFINKLDRDHADPKRAVRMIREKLGLKCAPIQLNIGISFDFEGVVDIVERKAYYFDGKQGQTVREEKVPDFLVPEMEEARKELISTLADCGDPKMEDHFLNETDPTPEDIHASIRAATVATKFVPIMMGSAYKNKGVQPLLDAVTRYLPNPQEQKNKGTLVKQQEDEEHAGRKIWVQQSGDDAVVELETDDEKPLIAMIFKLERLGHGMTNYIRVYQGKFRKSDQLINVRTGKVFNIPNLVRMHSNKAEPIDIVSCGEICAITGDVEASSGDTIMKAAQASKVRVACENMFVPPCVIAMSFTCADKQKEVEVMDNLGEFMREDPTLRVSKNQETNEILMEGMGELHLDIYVERLKREKNLIIIPGKPTVNYREVITERYDFDYVYKRQSGGQGQWAHVKGFVEPLPVNMSSETGRKNRVFLKCSNSEIRESLQKSFQKAFERKLFLKGPIIGAPVWGVSVTLTGGAMHEVDSNDIAFQNAATHMWTDLFNKFKPALVEPFMTVEITTPKENMAAVQQEFSSREGVVRNMTQEGDSSILAGETALSNMFGFITDLRKLTKGRGEFSMEFKEYAQMPTYKAQEVANERNEILGRKLFSFSS